MKRAILPLLLLFIGCDLFNDEVVTSAVPVEIDLTLSSATYTSSQSITVSAETNFDEVDIKYVWKIDNNNFNEGSSSQLFGPYSDDSSHIVTCGVIINMDTTFETIRLKSEEFQANAYPVEKYGRLQVIGTNLCDEYGDPVQLRGMSTHGIQYFENFYSEKSVQALAEEWEVDVIRISNYVNEGGWNEGDYLENPSYWKTYVDSMVVWAERYNIYALIDWHMLSPGDPNFYTDEAVDFWKYMVNNHGEKRNVLFDICNEPNNEGLTTWKHNGTDWEVDSVILEGKTVTWNMIKEFADEIMPIIRAKSDNVAIIGTPQWASRPDLVADNPLSYDDVMYTMHFYAAEHGQGYRTYVQDALDDGIPVFVTEFGTQEASGDGENDWGESEAWMTFLNQNNISWCNWNFSNDFRTGAVFETSFSPASASLTDFSDSLNLKVSGEWILDHIKNR